MKTITTLITSIALVSVLAACGKSPAESEQQANDAALQKSIADEAAKTPLTPAKK